MNLDLHTTESATAVLRWQHCRSRYCLVLVLQHTCRLTDLSITLPVGRISTSTPVATSAYTPLLPGGCWGGLGATATSTNRLPCNSLSVTGRGVRLKLLLLPAAAALPLPAPACEVLLTDQACVAEYMQAVQQVVAASVVASMTIAATA